MMQVTCPVVKIFCLLIMCLSCYHGDGMLYVCLALAQFPDKHPYLL